ncbi:MAG: lipocalin family protein [Chitinophagales bacterium]|nr:lipocalin family protein [Chitinophagales bacterium]
MKYLIAVFTLIVMMSATCNTNNCLPVTVDSNANQAQFLGTWYEIASIPQFFNIGCQCTSAEYVANGSNIIVKNSCRLGGATIGIPNNIQGTATVPDPNVFGKIKVRFPVSPVDADYWILEFDPNGQYMLVGDPNKNSLFILSRTRTLNQGIYNNLVSTAQDMCFDVNKLKITNQSNCSGY